MVRGLSIHDRWRHFSWMIAKDVGLRWAQCASLREGETIGLHQLAKGAIDVGPVERVTGVNPEEEVDGVDPEEVRGVDLVMVAHGDSNEE